MDIYADPQIFHNKKLSIPKIFIDKNQSVPEIYNFEAHVLALVFVNDLGVDLGAQEGPVCTNFNENH